MTREGCSGFSPNPPASFGNEFDRRSLPVPEIIGGDKVYVAVGKSVEKAVSLFHWTFRRFTGGEICILHVHQPSPLIPTLLGNLPASQANPDVVRAYRTKEKDEMLKLLLSYTSLCTRSKVSSCIVTTENDHVRKGIVDLINEHSIQKLVMGALPENWMKVKKNSSKSSFVAKNAPPICRIWFVNKGQLLYTKEPAEDHDALLPLALQDSSPLRSRSVRYSNRERELRRDYRRCNSSTSLVAGSTSIMRSSLSNTSSDSGYSSSNELDPKIMLHQSQHRMNGSSQSELLSNFPA
ncbi:U-box domain-containing protein 33-like [Rutidosis leptorrhynchoides]|uniref:U-box domain-containing protein 33-like n=1 Tax=Rutidosis leptorrhynchoides TaxID=125765 RepID=UPI003A9A37ED